MKIKRNVIDIPPSLADWRVGAETGIKYEVNIKDGNWSQYLPTEEKQRKKAETSACVTFSSMNSLEAQYEFQRKNGKISDEIHNYLKKQGYIDNNGRLNLSDRFIAKVSGTTIQGNSLIKVWDTINNFGVLPESDWSFSETMSFNEFYSEIPQNLKNKAKKFLDIFDINYEWVYYGNTNISLIKQHLKQAPLHIATPVCYPWERNGVITNCGKRVCEHATMLYNCSDSYIEDFDTYSPFNKKLSLDYYIPAVIKGILKVKDNPQFTFEKNYYIFDKDLQYRDKNDDVVKLQDVLKLDGCFPKNILSTGYFGNITREAVKKFQKKYNVCSYWEWLLANGRAGSKTRAKLNELYGKTEIND